MRLSIYVSPDRTSFSTTRGMISAREAENCEAIAAALVEAGAEVQVVEGPVPPSSRDVALVFAVDLEWHLRAGVASERLVVLNPERDCVLEIAERYRVAACVFYIGIQAWKMVSNGLVVRRDVGARLGGTLGPGRPYFMASEHYASWTHPGYFDLAELLVAYLRVFTTPDVPSIMPETARAHGLAEVAIDVDPKRGGMAAQLFPTKDTYLALSGPPGAALALVIWDCSELPTNDVEAAIRAKVVEPWTTVLEMGRADRGRILGEERAGMTFATGSGHARIAWFGVVVTRPAARLLVAVGVAGTGPELVTAADVLANRAIAAVVPTLTIS